MAMLMMNDVFERTWGERAGAAAGRRLLADRDPGRQARPSRTSSSSPRPTGTSSGRSSSRASTTATTSGSTTGSCTTDAEAVRGHLQRATPPTRSELVRFIENHDEPRAAATFPRRKARAAAVTTLTQTGARLVHEGQLEGRHACSCRSSSPAGPTSRADADAAGVLRAAAGRARRRRLPRRRVAARRAQRLGRATTRWQNLVAWGWRGESAQARRRQPRRRHRVRPRLAPVGRPARAGLAARRRRRPASATSAAATTSATASTSPSSPWALAPLRPDATREAIH